MGNNTEKPTGKAEQKKQTVVSIPKQKQVTSAPIKKENLETETVSEIKKEDKKPEVKKVKKDFAVTNIKSLPVSTKQAMAICRFIKNKEIKTAIEDLESVARLKKAVPMKGEIPHRKGKIMSGRFPTRAAKNFIMILKNLQSNSDANGLENPIIKEAVPNQASRPRGKGGRTQKKRTHINLLAVEKKSKNKKLAPQGVPSKKIKEGRGKK